MLETAQTDNLLIREETDVLIREVAEPAGVIYDAAAFNRFEYEVRHDDGLKYDTAHVYKPLSDERYLQWIREFKVKGNEDDVSEESREASVRLWDDLIVEVENIEYPEGADWKSLIDSQQKIESLNEFLAVAIVDDDSKATGKIKLGAENATQTFTTEAYFNGEILRQKHVLKKKSFEHEKQYSRIQGKRFKQEPIKGLSKRKPKIEYVPQDERIGGLYDELFVSGEGFADGKIPLRFKTTVVHSIFESELDAKKSQK
jgi:hypothetical protein